MSHSRSLVVFRLIVVISLVFGACLAMKPDLAWAGSGPLAVWRMQTWTASSGAASNLGVALLSATVSGGNSGPFYTSTGAPPGETNVFISDGWANGSGAKYWKVRFITHHSRNRHR